jgi:hypothetical protein
MGANEMANGMTNTQLYLAIGLPMLLLIASMVNNWITISGIREDIREIRSDIKLLTGKIYELMAQKP